MRVCVDVVVCGREGGIFFLRVSVRMDTGAYGCRDIGVCV